MENTNDVIIEIKDLNKEYKMYKRKSDRLIESLFPFIKNDYRSCNSNKRYYKSKWKD